MRAPVSHRDLCEFLVWRQNKNAKQRRLESHCYICVTVMFSLSEAPPSHPVWMQNGGAQLASGQLEGSLSHESSRR